MSQPRLVSAVESVVNVVVGFGVAILSQLAVFPLFDIHVPLSANLQIGAWFTAISLVRSYVIRRWFNGLKFRPAATAAPKANDAMPADTLGAAAADALRIFDWLKRRSIYTDADFAGVHQRLIDALAQSQRGPLDRAEMDAVCRHALIEFSLGKHICYDDALIRETEAKHGITAAAKG